MMFAMETKRRKTPQEKKRDRYTKDHVTAAEYPHAHRKSWPKKKPKAHRSRRKKVNQLLAGVRFEEEADRIDGRIPNERIPRKTQRKVAAVRLGDAVRQRLEKRVERTAWNYFKDDLRGRPTAEDFERMLTTMMTEKSEASTVLKEKLRGSLKRPRFVRFFAARPALHRRVLRWLGAPESP